MKMEELAIAARYLNGDDSEEIVIQALDILDRSAENRAVANIAAACMESIDDDGFGNSDPKKRICEIDNKNMMK